MPMITTRQDPETGGFIFNIMSDSGQTLLRSVPFSDRSSMDAILAQLRELAKQPSAFERTTNYNGKFLFVFKDEKGMAIGNSLPYSSEAGMENGIENLKAGIFQLSNDAHL